MNTVDTSWHRVNVFAEDDPDEPDGRRDRSPAVSARGERRAEGGVTVTHHRPRARHVTPVWSQPRPVGRSDPQSSRLGANLLLGELTLSIIMDEMPVFNEGGADGQ